MNSFEQDSFFWVHRLKSPRNGKRLIKASLFLSGRSSLIW